MKRIYYIEARVSTDATVSVMAESEKEAMNRFNEGAWHGVNARQWDTARVEVFKSIKEGPKVNS